MASMTDFLEDKLRDHVLRNIPYTSPAAVYLRLFTPATTDAGGGTEVAGGSYTGKLVAFAAGGAGSGAADNSAPVDFTNMPATTVTHAALFDAAVGGNMLLHAALTASKTTNAGDTLTFAVGDIDAVFA
jgi:hypothetical protein